MQPSVQQMLDRKGAHYQVVKHSPAYSGLEQALMTGLKAEDVLKAIVLDSRGGHALAVLPSSRDLDMDRVRAVVGDEHVHLATEDEIRRDLPQFELGAIPPFGSLTGMTMYVDGEVLAHSNVAFAPGVETETVTAPMAEVFAGEMATVAPLTDWERERTEG